MVQEPLGIDDTKHALAHYDLIFGCAANVDDRGRRRSAEGIDQIREVTVLRHDDSLLTNRQFEKLPIGPGRMSERGPNYIVPLA